MSTKIPAKKAEEDRSIPEKPKRRIIRGKPVRSTPPKERKKTGRGASVKATTDGQGGVNVTEVPPESEEKVREARRLLQLSRNTVTPVRSSVSGRVVLDSLAESEAEKQRKREGKARIERQQNITEMHEKRAERLEEEIKRLKDEMGQKERQIEHRERHRFNQALASLSASQKEEETAESPQPRQQNPAPAPLPEKEEKEDKEEEHRTDNPEPEPTPQIEPVIEKKDSPILGLRVEIPKYAQSPFIKSSFKSPRSALMSPAAAASLNASQDKLAAIMTYLDDIEGQGTKKEEAIHDDIMEVKPLQPSVTEVKMKVMGLELEVSEQAKVIQMLKNALNEEREKRKALTTKARTAEKSRLDHLKHEYEAALSQQMDLSNQLLRDKEELARKCESLAGDIQRTEAQLLQKLEEQKDSFARELKRKKDAWTQAEKIRRETLVQRLTEEIRERTIKGLEPEVQRMLTKHKQEIEHMTQSHEHAIQAMKASLARERDNDMEAMRDKLNHEHVEETAHQLEIMRGRMAGERERFHEAFETERQRLQSLQQGEMTALEERFESERSKMAEEIARIEAEAEQRIAAVKADHDAALQEKDAVWKDELDRMQSEQEERMKNWQESYDEQVKAAETGKEENMKKRLEQERDAEIDMIIRRLDEDTTKSKREFTEKHFAQIELLRSQHDQEMDRVTASRDDYSAKYHQAISDVNHLEEQSSKSNRQLIQAQDDLVERDARISDLERRVTRCQGDIDNARHETEMQFDERFKETERQRRVLEDQIDDERRKLERASYLHQEEIAEVSRRKEAELNMVHARVKKAIKAKDEAVQQALERAQLAEGRVAQVEAMMERQRQELLK